MFDMSVTDDMSRVEKLTEERDEQRQNMFDMSSADDVSRPERSADSKDEHSLNMRCAEGATTFPSRETEMKSLPLQGTECR